MAARARLPLICSQNVQHFSGVGLWQALAAFRSVQQGCMPQGALKLRHGASQAGMNVSSASVA